MNRLGVALIIFTVLSGVRSSVILGGVLETRGGIRLANTGHGFGLSAAPLALAPAPLPVSTPPQAINPWALSPVGPSGVVTGAGASGPSGVVNGAGAVGPSGIVTGRGAVGPTGPNGQTLDVAVAVPALATHSAVAAPVAIGSPAVTAQVLPIPDVSAYSARVAADAAGAAFVAESSRAVAAAQIAEGARQTAVATQTSQAVAAAQIAEGARQAAAAAATRVSVAPVAIAAAPAVDLAAGVGLRGIGIAAPAVVAAPPVLVAGPAVAAPALGHATTWNSASNIDIARSYGIAGSIGGIGIVDRSEKW